MTVQLADLDRLYPAASQGAKDKSKDSIEPFGRQFIAHSPFCVISAAGPDGSIDVSPRGGQPGFVHVSEDGKTLSLPDRSGNNLLDTLRNLLSGSGQIGMMFMVPGSNDIYRVNGRATATIDAATLAGFIEFGKPPRLVIEIAVEEAFIHCPKALMRSKIWDPTTQVNRENLPRISKMIVDRMKQSDPSATEEKIIDGYKAQL